MLFRQPWYRFVPMLSVMGIIFFLSHQPGDTVVLPDLPNIDKLLHSLVYGTLAAVTLYAIPEKTIRRYPWRSSVSVVLFCLLYGCSDEWHQSFIPGRSSSGWDIAADTLGAVVIVFFWVKWSVLGGRRQLPEKYL
jgi:VanZ family protein